LGETDAPTPVRAEEWVWERIKVRGLAFADRLVQEQTLTLPLSL
jgi:hypothetical protein